MSVTVCLSPAAYSKLLSEETLGSESDSDAARDGTEGAGDGQKSAVNRQTRYMYVQNTSISCSIHKQVLIMVRSC